MARKKKNGTGANTSLVANPPSAKPKGSVPKALASVPKAKGPSPIKLSAPSSEQVAQIANMVGEMLGKKKHKKKKGLLGKIGSFMSGALDKVLGIAPSIAGLLGNTVHPDWRQGNHTKASLQKLALPGVTYPFAYPINDGVKAPNKKSVVISRRSATIRPQLIDAIRNNDLNPVITSSVPVATATRVSADFKTIGTNHAKFGAGLRIVGTDFWDDIPFADSETRGALVAMMDLNPARWDGTRIARYASMYERFEINTLAVVYSPACATTTPGSLVSWFDYDPEDPAGTSRDTVVRAIGSPGQDNSPVWCGHCAHFRKDKEQFDYYVDADGSDNRLTSAGTYRCTVLSDVNMAAGTGAYGTLSIVYDISFYVNSVQQEITGFGPMYWAQGSGGMTPAIPFGTQYPTTNDDNTMTLSYDDLGDTASVFYDFVGTETSPSRYFAFFNITGTGITAMSMNLVGGLTSVTSRTIVNAAGTEVWGIKAFDCDNAGVDNPSDSYIQIIVTGTTVATSTIRVWRIPGGLTLTNLTVQDFEKKTLDLEKKYSMLETMVKAMVASSTASSTSQPLETPPSPTIPPLLRSDSMPVVDKGKKKLEKSEIKCKLFSLLNSIPHTEENAEKMEILADFFRD